MGHIGLLPQGFRSDGYKVQGSDEASRKLLLEDAKAVEEAGAFALVIECVSKNTAKEIAKSISIPVIGIGAGSDVDGQVLVWSDMFGFFKKFSPKFVRQYIDGASIIKDGFKKYKEDVESGNFPNEDESYK
jgi:3-methyl-2-oxobutanoate hydroxymethyltransferase